MIIQLLNKIYTSTYDLYYAAYEAYVYADNAYVYFLVFLNYKYFVCLRQDNIIS